MDRNAEKIVLHKENEAVHALLTKFLPRMQAPALKHEYLTSIANVLMNPVAHGREPDGTVHIIGFGDRERSLPLYVIREVDGSVRHAFVPKPVPSKDRPHERRMLELLQQHEVDWSRDRGVTPRNIIREITNRKPDRVNSHGLSMVDPLAWGPDDRSKKHGGTWYDTDYLPERLSYDDRTPQEEVIELAQENVTRSARMAMPAKPGTSGPVPMSSLLSLESKKTGRGAHAAKTFQLRNITFEERTEPDGQIPTLDL